MQNNKNELDDHSAMSASPLPSPDTSGFSLPDPDEGHRLMRAFFGIRQPALRQAILTLVTELQKQSDETQQSLGDDARFRA